MQLAIRNQQRSHKIDLPLLRRILKALLVKHLKSVDADVGIFLVGAVKMTDLNETFLQHKGSTDVITFDYVEDGGRKPNKSAVIHGEIFVCVDEAIIQARKFRTSWQSEIVRYAVHGVLHLLGHDDLRAVARKKMKAEENRIVTALGTEFDFRRLDIGRKAPKLKP
jgi:probable rRNA maturation factor